jgi:hypothetical protein
MKDPLRYEEIFVKIVILHAELSALWMQPGGGKNISPEEANEISTSLLPDLQNLVNETKLNLANYAQNKA